MTFSPNAKPSSAFWHKLMFLDAKLLLSLSSRDVMLKTPFAGCSTRPSEAIRARFALSGCLESFELLRVVEGYKPFQQPASYRRTCVRRGSKASRSASPRRLKLIKAKKMKSPGKKTCRGGIKILVR